MSEAASLPQFIAEPIPTTRAATPPAWARTVERPVEDQSITYLNPQLVQFASDRERGAPRAKKLILLSFAPI